MDTDLTCVRTLDYGVAYSVANDPVIFEAFTEDGAAPFAPDVVNEFWIAMITEEGELAGCYNLKQILNRTFDIHAFMLPEYRDKYAKISGYRILEWCLNNLEFDKIVTSIPKNCKHIYHFVKLFGFVQEGFDRACFEKNGKLIGMYKMGITKDEVRAVMGVSDE